MCDTLHAKRAGHPADVCTYCVRFKGVLIATQLNSTDPVEQRTAKSVVFFVYDVTTYKLSQLGH